MIDHISLSEKPDPHNGVTDNAWRHLRDFTAARIGLGRSGVSIPTSELLAFQLAHAQARDAVHTPLNFDDLQQKLAQLIKSQSCVNSNMPIKLKSQAGDRFTYLQRPDLGRRLNEASTKLLQQQDLQQTYDLAIVVADGLSATAIEQNALPFIESLLQALKIDEQNWTVAPISLVEQGRVAIGDEIGKLLNADIVLILIGERPGLSSPDSLGLYLTWAPRVGLNDASRNCISNIRPEGLSYSSAVQKALYLLCESRRLKLSGVNLKDRSNSLDQDVSGTTIEHEIPLPTTHFLI